MERDTQRPYARFIVLDVFGDNKPLGQHTTLQDAKNEWSRTNCAGDLVILDLVEKKTIDMPVLD